MWVSDEARRLQEESVTNTAYILLIVFYLIFVNALGLLYYSFNDYRLEQKKEPLSDVLLYAIMVLGGGPGALLGMYFYHDRRNFPALYAAVSMSAAWIVLAVVLFTLIPKNVSPDASRDNASVSTTVPEESTEDPEIARARKESEEAASRKAASEEASRKASEEESARIASSEEASRQSEEESIRASEEEAAAESSRAQAEAEEASRKASEEAAAEPRYITISAIGDMLMHPGVSGSARQPDGTYDYTVLFQPILSEIMYSDIAVVNNEIPFGGDEFGLQNYPNFNVYTALGDAEAQVGFDVILNATNHVRDMGTNGILRTMEFWKKYPLMTSIGIHESPEDQQVVRIVERNGIKVAVLNYCYGINAGFPAETPYMIDMMREEDKPKIIQDLQYAEWAADFTVVFPHWGEEYQLRQNSTQEAWAQFFTEYGADLIIGTHPHVLEPIKTVTAANGNTSLCYYSLGNYISLQDETFSVLGGLAKVVLVKDPSGTRIADHSIQYLVTHYMTDVSWARVYKLEDYTQELASQHGILNGNLPGNGYNQYYPFSLDTLYRVINEVNSY